MSPQTKDKLRNFFEDFLRRLMGFLETLPAIHLFYSKYSKKIAVPVLLLCGYMVGDIGSALLSSFVTLKSTKSKNFERPVKYVQEKAFIQARSRYEAIATKNLFCPGCVIPDIKSIAAIRPKDCSKAKPLPGGGIRIIGTIVLSDAKYSVATIADGGTEASAVKIGDRFKSYGKVFEIRRNRICFEKDDGILQAVDAPEDTFKFGQPLATNFSGASTEGISRVNENEVQIAKSLYQEKITDPSTLLQAHAEAVKDATGAIRGFKILSLAPGSVFESLGFQPEDVIVGANGEPVNSLAKAQELYATAASTTEMSIEIERGGQRVTKTFKVK